MPTTPFLSWILAAVHLTALGLGLGAVWSRGRSLKDPSDPIKLKRALTADTLWGIAALIWISTGLIRAFSSLEKGSAYYLDSSSFWIKMGLLGLILILEVWPMVTFIRWRIKLARGETIDTRNANLFSQISVVQSALVVAMVFAASAMARGLNF